MTQIEAWNPRVLVGRDPALDEIFDRIALRLEALGCTVVRQHEAGALPLDLDRYDIFCINSRTPVDRRALAAARRLRGIVYVSSGSDGCDVEAARELGIEIRTGATVENVESMAEALVLLAGSLMLELPQKQRLVAVPERRPRPLAMGSRMLAGKTFGFVGFGRIAQAAVARFAGWKPGRLLAHTRTPDPERWPEVEFVPLNQLLADSDVVSVTLPLSDATRGYIGRRELDRMRQRAYLICLSRGGIVVENDLVEALEKGSIAGAALDVFEAEPPSPAHPLTRFDNVLLTPHIVGHTREAFESLIPAAIDNVFSFDPGPFNDRPFGRSPSCSNPS